jgi:mannosyltransferase
MGSIMPVKGIDLLIDAFMYLLKDDPSATLDIAGDYNNDFAESLKEKTKSISNIHWLGVVQKEEKRNFFNNIDVHCVPSLDEPSGLTLLEGIMMGKVVITTDKTGANYAVDDGKSGFIVPAGCVEKLTQAMKDLCLKKDLSFMQKNSRQMYLKEATIEQYHENILKMVEDNVNNLPIVNTKLKFERRKILCKKKSANGKRTYYFLGIKIFSYRKK